MKLLMICFFINMGCPLLKGRISPNVGLYVSGEGAIMAYKIEAEEGDEIFNIERGVFIEYNQERNILKIETEKGVLIYMGVQNLNPSLVKGQIIEENTVIGYLDSSKMLVVKADNENLAQEIREVLHCSCGY